MDFVPPSQPPTGARTSAMIEWTALLLTLKLALVVCAILVVIGMPIAAWLSFTRWRWKFLIESVVALPLVLPPTVLGFYVLVALGSNSPVGRWYHHVTGHGLAFTFEGLADRLRCSGSFRRSPFSRWWRPFPKWIET